jgi:hypothetical protein
MNKGDARPVKRYVVDVFHAGKLVLLTVVSGQQGTVVYREGILVRQFTELRPPTVCFGRFVVGDSPTADDTWQGELQGLAIYRSTLPAHQVMANYRSWTTAGRPAKNGPASEYALYFLSENDGNLIRDHGTSGVDLFIPETYVIAQPIFLGLPLRSYDGDWDDVQDIIINIAGFVPFGFTLSALLVLNTHLKRSDAIAALSGLAVSLTIEILQYYLPTRNSDLSDVLTNTLGTCVGVMLWRKWRFSSLFC